VTAVRAPTPEQAAAIEIAGRDVLLEAGAGTGKTGVMVDRYCRLVCDEGVPLEAILAFTFTDKAAAELRERIRAGLSRRAAAGSERARSLLGEIGGAWVTTIHGFCNRLLAGHPVAVGIDPRFRVLDAPEAERVAHEAFDEALEDFLAGDDESREETVAAFGIDGLRAIVSGAHAELRSRGVAAPALPEPPEPDARELEAPEAGGTDGAQEIPSAAAAAEGDEAYRHLAALLELFSGRFEAAKRRRGGVDFEDLQILAAALLERTEIGEAYRARFSHLLVDEFQDTNRLQLRLIEALRGPSCELMAVGDEFQSIYGFRHADLDVFREQRRLIEAEPGGERMELSGNFRSRPELVGALNALGGALLGAGFHPLRVGAAAPPEPPPGEGSAVELLLTSRDGWDGDEIELEPAVDDRTPLNCLAEARFVALRLRALADAGVERGEMVVLLRAFTHLDAYEDSLARAGLRPYVVGGRGYWSQQQVADVCALLATIANPLDDQALFGALASPVCGLAPDTLWLLRAAAGQRRHVWPAIERAAERGEPELPEPRRLGQIPAAEIALLRRFATTIGGLRERAGRLSLPALIEAAVVETGYDLAVLTRPAGEARLANVRKLSRLAAEFESREGRDLRGLLDFLAARAENGDEAQAATAAESHDGVRIMTVHNAKGLEFGVVAVPDLSRSLLAGSRPPLLALGRGEQPRAGLRLRRLGAPSVDLYDYAALCEEAQRRESEEGLRLFHVAATRARDRLILSGVVKPEAGRETAPGTAAIERIVEAFGIDRERDSTLPVAAAEPREGLDASFPPSEIAVRVNLPSPGRAAELTAARRGEGATRSIGTGPPPLVGRRPPAVPSRPLSYSAISAYEDCPYRFYLERVLDLGASVRSSSRIARQSANGPGGSAGGERTAHGAAVHSLLEWSQANGWSEPAADLVRRHAIGAGLDPGADGVLDGLLEPIRGWLGSRFFADRVAASGATTRAEVPFLLGVGEGAADAGAGGEPRASGRDRGSVLRGSIDLLVEQPDRPPLIVDYKTDRLDGSSPAEHAARYEVQRAIYALAVGESRRAPEVELAYVFLERPDEPVLQSFGSDALGAARDRLTAAIERIGSGEFPPAAAEDRGWSLCQGCPALGRMCSGPKN
jgi:ATP-dependent helicase/nuclease subunit A